MNVWTPEPGGPYDVDEHDGATREIDLGNGYVAIVDAADYRTVRPYSWAPLIGHNGKVYAMAHGGTRRGTVYLHRLIAGTTAGQETDHRDGDGLNNRRANLRTASPSQNRANMGKPRRPDGAAHTSQYKGVTWRKDMDSWSAKITAVDPILGRSRCRSLGMFADEAEAARAYDAAALAQWGEFARLNFPRGEEVAG